ncbi:MAG: tryptophan-rich sensory protein [Candidatus Hydrogenedentes bacterium]|nr:tryptophan-rich sensory protein [Candidatus Hydrogenedentota bacterium]
MDTGASKTNHTLRAAVALAGFLALCYGVAALGGIATSSSVNTWYTEIEKPSWTPPGSVIGTVWSVLYSLMALAAWLVYLRGGVRANAIPLSLWAVQLALNLAWSFLFFGLRNPGAALVELVLLWIAIAATTIAFARVRTSAMILMLPYLVWVAFAGFLNAAVWLMNRG